MLNVSPLTINRYKKAVGITSNCKPVTRTAEKEQASILKSMKIKATNKLIKKELANIKSLPTNEQISKVDELRNKNNILSEQLKSHTEYNKGIKG